MDKLHQTIADKRAEVEDLRKRVAVLEAELSALELADRLRPATTASVGRATQQGARKGGGRRQGDISQVWRGILQGVYALGSPVDYTAVEKVAQEQGHELEMSSIRDRVRNLVKTGLMAGDVQSGFTVTQDAVERFGFTKGNEASAGASEANAEGGNDTLGAQNPNQSPLWQ